jgi:hypothetical protein
MVVFDHAVQYPSISRDITVLTIRKHPHINRIKSKTMENNMTRGLLSFGQQRSFNQPLAIYSPNMSFSEVFFESCAL